MRVFAYTADLDVEKIDLPAREVAERGIDFLRLDLCDTDPIIETIAGQRLYFSRLREFQFAYPKEDGSGLHVLGLNDGHHTCCVEGVPEKNPTALMRPLCMRDFSPTRESFSHHLGEYLYRIFESPAIHPVWMCHCGGLPVKAKRRSLIFDTPYFRNARDLGARMPVRFGGEMAAIVEIQIKWHENIQWLFQRFAAWEPVVFGEALYRSLLGLPIERVDFSLVKPLSVEELQIASEAQVETSQGRSCFQANSITYAWYPAPPPVRHVHSIELLRAYGHKSTSSRIALHDVFKRQTRILNPSKAVLWDNMSHPSWPGCASDLRTHDVTLLPDVTSGNNAGIRCHTDPIVGALAEGFRRATNLNWAMQDTRMNGRLFVARLEQLPNEGMLLASRGCTHQELFEVLAELSEEARLMFAAGRRSAACFTAADLEVGLRKRFAKIDFGCNLGVGEIVSKLREGIALRLTEPLADELRKSHKPMELRQRLIDVEGYCIHCAAQKMQELHERVS